MNQAGVWVVVLGDQLAAAIEGESRGGLQAFCVVGRLGGDKISGDRKRAQKEEYVWGEEKDSVEHRSSPAEAVGDSRLLGWLMASNPPSGRKAPGTQVGAPAGLLDL